MSRISAGFVVAVLGLVMAVAPASGATRATLRVAGTEPLAVRGVAFRPGERVSLTAMTLLGPKRTVVRASHPGASPRRSAFPTQSVRQRIHAARRRARSEARRRCGCPAAPACRRRFAEGTRTATGGVAPARRVVPWFLERYFEGRTSIWVKPPFVSLWMRICVPVFGTFTLFHSAW